MQGNKRKKHASILVIFFLMLSMMTPAAEPLVLHASEEDEFHAAEEDRVGETEKTNKDLELQTISEVKEQAAGDATTKGVVTAKWNDTIQIQDDTGAISVQATNLDVDVGDEITISGNVGDDHELLYMEQADLVDKSTDGDLPEPLILAGDELEDYQSKLAVIENVTLLAASPDGDSIIYTAEDEAGNRFLVRNENGELNLGSGITYDSITGIIIKLDDVHQLVPRTQADLAGEGSLTQSVTASPEAGEVPAGTEVTLDIETNDADIIYTTDGSDPAENGQRYNGSITVDEDVTIQAFAEKDGFTASESEFHYTVYEESEDRNMEQEVSQVKINDTEEEFELAIMHMNDTHARVEPMPRMLTAINEFRADNPDNLLLHAGDVFSGTLYFNKFKGQADLALMNLMDFDAMVFGNHEFDLGLEEGGHESLAAFVENANFPFLGTNIDFSRDPFMGGLETNQSLVRNPNAGEVYDSIILEVDGEEIGIFGLDTEDTANIANPGEVTFEDFVETAEEAVANFEEAGIDKIIALTHLGFDSAPELGNDLRLAEEVDGIDIIVGGHSHTALEAPVEVVGETNEPTIIAQAGQYAEHLGTLNVTFDENGVVTEFNGELLDLEDYDADEKALEALAPYKQEVDELMTEEIGATAMKDLRNPRHGEGDEDSVRADETELGNLITDAMLAGAQEDYPETVIAFQNGGGIRAPINEGEITTGEVIEVLPFGNNPVVATLTGQEIKDILEHSVRQAPDENGGFLHVSGMKFYYDSEKEPGNRVVQMYVNIGGELVELLPDEAYQITTNAFTAQGGDGFETFAEVYEDGRVRDIGGSDWEQFRDYMVEDLNGIVDPEIEGRIVDLMGEEFTGLPEDPGDGDDNGSNGDATPGENGEDTDDTTPGGNDTGSDDDDTGTGTTDDDQKTGGVGKVLPDTATNMYLYLLIGSLLLTAGGGILLYKRKFSGKSLI